MGYEMTEGRLHDDPAEQHNLQAEHPEVVARLTRLLERYVADGRSTPGRPPEERHARGDPPPGRG
jgi:hypothetical protein